MLKMIACFALHKGLQIKVPKRRGSGFLKTPCGHHHEPWMHDIGYDVDGLDGMLDIDCGYVKYEDRKAMANKIMPLIQKRFKFDWVLVDSRKDFWDA